VGLLGPVAAGAFAKARRWRAFCCPDERRHMSKWTDYLRFMTNEATSAILAAILAVCFFAFVLDADRELVLGLLAIGLFTAILEARLHAHRRDN
jgi:hypothetical protein